jgi:hypothetical protein
METVTADKLFAFENKEFGADVCMSYDCSATIVRLDHHINTAFWMEFDLGKLRNEYEEMQRKQIEEKTFTKPYIAGRYDSGASTWDMKLDSEGNVSIISVTLSSLSNIGQRSITPFLSFNINNFIE